MLFFEDDDDNNALTHSLARNVCEYFLLPMITSLSHAVRFSIESIFSIPQVNNWPLFRNSSKAVLKFIAGGSGIDELLHMLVIFSLL